MYIVTLINGGVLQSSSFSAEKETVLKVVRQWYSDSYPTAMGDGYIAVEVARAPGETAKRILQVDLDEEPEDLELYLEDKIDGWDPININAFSNSGADWK